MIHRRISILYASALCFLGICTPTDQLKTFLIANQFQAMHTHVVQAEIVGKKRWQEMNSDEWGFRLLTISTTRQLIQAHPQRNAQYELEESQHKRCQVVFCLADRLTLKVDSSYSELNWEPQEHVRRKERKRISRNTTRRFQNDRLNTLLELSSS